MQTTSNGQSATTTAVQMFKVGQMEFPVLNATVSGSVKVTEGKASKKGGLRSATLSMLPLHNKSGNDLAHATGEKGASLKIVARNHADSVADWMADTMGKMIRSGEWTAKNVRVNGKQSCVAFALRRVEKRVDLDQSSMLKALGITAEQLAIAKQVKSTSQEVLIK